MSSQKESLSVAEFKRVSTELIASSDRRLKTCANKVETLEQALERTTYTHNKIEAHLKDYQAKQLFPELFESAKQLPDMKLRLAISQYNHAELLKEKEFFQSRFSTTMRELCQLRRDKTNETLQQELAKTKELLLAKTTENASKDRQILDLKKTAAACRQSEIDKSHELSELQKQVTELKYEVKIYQEESEIGYNKKLAASHAYAAELEEMINKDIARIEETNLLTFTALKESHALIVAKMEQTHEIAAAKQHDAHLATIASMEEAHALSMQAAHSLTVTNIEKADRIAVTKYEAQAAHIERLEKAHATTITNMNDSHNLVVTTMEQAHALATLEARALITDSLNEDHALIVASMEQWHNFAIVGKDELHARIVNDMKEAHTVALTDMEEAHTLTISELEGAHQVKTLEMDNALEEMTSYAEHVVAHVNHAWYYGAKTMASLRHQLKEVGVEEWCNSVETPSSDESSK
ncbi:hypothetical protein NX059_001517 [Plenodomus lindquistii]|nr:hypothetical protein NX059_001517 [Plenodomus lindquistii]